MKVRVLVQRAIFSARDLRFCVRILDRRLLSLCHLDRKRRDPGYVVRLMASRQLRNLSVCVPATRKGSIHGTGS
jgi:hypothetical protein